MPDDPEDLERIKARADALLPEEEEAGSDDPVAQAAAILEDSDEREFARDDPNAPGLEQRRSEDTVDLPDPVEGQASADESRPNP
jgi:hypothetical protein